MSEPAAVSVAALYRSLWRYARGARGSLLAATALLIASQLVRLGVPWLSAQAINALQLGQGAGLRQAAGWAGLVLLAHVGAWALHGPGRVLERTVSVRVRQGVADALYARLTQAPLAWHEQQHSGELQHRIAQASQALYQFAQSQFIYLQSAVSFVGPVIALWLLSRSSGLLALIGYALVSGVIVRFDRSLMRLAAAENQAERRYAAGLLEYLGHIGTVLSLRLGANTQRLLNERLKAVFAPLRRSIVLNESKWFSVDMLSLGLTWGLVAAYVWQRHAAGEALLIGTVFMLYQYAQQAGSVLNTMAGNFQNFARARTDYASAELVWQAPPPVPPGVALPADWREIEITGLGYRHTAPPAAAQGASPPRAAGLEGVSLRLRRGERIALVGPSGAGKSTLMRVIAGLYAPQRGQIAVDGQPLPGLAHLGGAATLIPQEADVFEASVRQNIGFEAAADASALQRALHTSVFDEVAAQLPQGLDTQISERGYNLSGGQRQRLCLARGLYAARHGSLLLLDEPTSALDVLSEAQVYERLRGAHADVCVIASVHRLGLLSHFDTVVLMAAGRVLDAGSADDLAARQPVFRTLLQTAPEGGAGASQPSAERIASITAR